MLHFGTYLYVYITTGEESNTDKIINITRSYMLNLVPGLFLRGRKDPGRSWSRATQILGGKLKKHLGRGGRVLRLENYNLCA